MDRFDPYPEDLLSHLFMVQLLHTFAYYFDNDWHNTNFNMSFDKLKFDYGFNFSVEDIDVTTNIVFMEFYENLKKLDVGQAIVLLKLSLGRIPVQNPTGV